MPKTKGPQPLSAKAPDPSSPVPRLQKAAKRAKDEGDIRKRKTALFKTFGLEGEEIEDVETVILEHSFHVLVTFKGCAAQLIPIDRVANMVLGLQALDPDDKWIARFASIKTDIDAHRTRSTRL